MDSFSCWKAMTSNPESTKITIIAATTTTEPLQQQTKATTLTIPLGTFSTNMSFGITHPNVLILQRILNNLGYTITINGPGSPGNETAKFGSLTRDAVRRFQCAKQIVCSGDEGTTGYGYVGNRTRLALINMYNQTTPKEVNKQTQKTTSNEDQIATLESQIQTLQNNIMELRAKVEILKSGH
jgi:peptidoglycan hydrolase-like protein with peptidoglycan-binding domain